MVRRSVFFVVASLCVFAVISCSAPSDKHNDATVSKVAVAPLSQSASDEVKNGKTASGDETAKTDSKVRKTPKKSKAQQGSEAKTDKTADKTQTKNETDNVQDAGSTTDLAKLNAIGCEAILAGDYDKAEQCFMKMLSFDNKDGLAHYNLACVYSLKNEKTKSIRSLKSAIDNGYLEIEHIAVDPDLTNIREEDQYKQIMAEAEKFLKSLHSANEAELAELNAEAEKINGIINSVMDELESVRDMKFSTPVNVQVMTKKQAESVGLHDVRGVYFNVNTPLVVIKPEDEKDMKRYEGVWIHETAHALQDQNFNLASVHGLAKNSDQALAVKALIEGEANYLMTLVFLARNPENMMMKTFLDMELNDAEEKSFTYFDGGKFVRFLKERGGWEFVAKSYTDLPPLSTNHILHPEKYLDGYAAPVTVKLDGLVNSLKEGWELSAPDVVGEYRMLSMLMSSGVEKNSSKAATAGWNGDSYITGSTSNGDELFAWSSVWETEKDAVEFFEQYEKFNSSRYTNFFNENGVSTWTGDKESVVMVRNNTNVRLLISTLSKEDTVKLALQDWR